MLQSQRKSTRAMRAATLFAAAIVATAPSGSRAASITADEAHEIGVEAYVYLYPLVIMDLTRLQATNIDAGKEPGRGPLNAFSNIPAFPDASFRVVVRPNFDTLYSSGWLDLTKEPMVVSVPDTGGRYYLLPILDMWTDVFASPGWRTTGTSAGHFAVVPPGWTGKLPKDVGRIDAPTPYVWIIGRTKTDGPSDYDAVHKIQKGYEIAPLSKFGKEKYEGDKVKVDPNVDMKTPPLEQVNAMSAAKYFQYASELMKLHPPHITDQPIVDRMKRLGFEVGKTFDLSKADPTVQQALANAPADGLQRMKDRAPTMAQVVNGWSMNTTTMGVYGTYYVKRAIVSMVGLGANLPEDAIYPGNLADATGKPLDGANQYVLHFTKDLLPPVGAFWSVTLYDTQGFQVANSINRFALSSWMPFQYNADGSLDFYFQSASPGKEKESNWLPAPAGPFNLTMRLYAPKQSALLGSWNPPPVTMAAAN